MNFQNNKNLSNACVYVDSSGHWWTPWSRFPQSILYDLYHAQDRGHLLLELNAMLETIVLHETIIIRPTHQTLYADGWQGSELFSPSPEYPQIIENQWPANVVHVLRQESLAPPPDGEIIEVAKLILLSWARRTSEKDDVIRHLITSDISPESFQKHAAIVTGWGCYAGGDRIPWDDDLQVSFCVASAWRKAKRWVSIQNQGAGLLAMPNDELTMLDVGMGLVRKGQRFADLCLRQMESTEKAKAKLREEFLCRPALPRIPFMLNIVLNESKNIEDIFKVAFQIRESTSAKTFRKWAANVDKDLLEGRNIDDAIAEAHRAAGNIVRVRCKTSADELRVDKIAHHGETHRERRTVGGHRAAAAARA